MQYAGSESWTVVEDQGYDLTAALYVHDALALPRDARTPPPLTPPVAHEPASGRLDPDRLSAAWEVWWDALIERRAIATTGENPRAWVRGACSDEELGALADGLVELAWRWSDERKVEHVRRFRQLTRPERLIVNEIVQSVAASMDRSLQPFRLSVTTLPVQGFWSWTASEQALLVSTQLRYDRSGFGQVLAPVVRALA